MENTRVRLQRQRGLVAGVCGGLGEFFGISPWWFRLGVIAMMLPGGLPGATIYIIAWIVIPRKK